MADETPTPAPDQTGDNTSPGIKTTEFWQGLIVIAAGAFLMVYGAIYDKGNLVDTGALLAGVQGIGYGVTRAVTKIKTA